MVLKNQPIFFFIFFFFLALRTRQKWKNQKAKRIFIIILFKAQSSDFPSLTFSLFSLSLAHSLNEQIQYPFQFQIYSQWQ